MACRFLESFDIGADATLKWTNYGVASFTLESAGRTGLGVSIHGAPYPYNIFDHQNTWIHGFAFKATNSIEFGIFSMSDSIAGVGQYGLTFKDDGTLEFGSAFGVDRSAYSRRLTLNQWYYIETKVFIHHTAGAYEVRLNGDASEPLLKATSVNTQVSANQSADVYGIYGYLYWPQWFDDMYVFDGTGVTNNDFNGDSVVLPRVPIANGSQNDFTRVPNDGTYDANWKNVRQVPQDGDASYVWSNTVGNKERYLITPYLSPYPAPSAVQVSTYVRKDAGSPHGVKTIVRPAATDHEDAETSLNASYQNIRRVYDVSPETGTAWTAEELNGTEFGVELTS